jgi:hydrogenase maturation protease
LTVPAPILIIGYGNPSRGDDAIGPTALTEIEQRLTAHKARERIELLTDFQLQIEFVTDLVGRECVVFIDASVSAASPYEFTRISAQPNPAVSSHALAPAHLLSVYERHYAHTAPISFLLAIKAYAFELGEPMSAAAQANLTAAVDHLLHWLDEPSEARAADA